jgi:hypothetical protein
MLNFKFIGWCHDPKNNHDKVWGVIRLDDDHLFGKVLIFWGRRGKKLQTKIDKNSIKLSGLILNKEYRGYKSINAKRLDEVYPEFHNDLEKTAMWAMLAS